LVTGQRRDEVGEMPHAELIDEATWSIPGARTKNKRDHIVPLSKLAQELIEAAPRVSDTFVFSTTGDTPVSGHYKMKSKLDELMLAEAKKDAAEPGKVEIEHWVLHDLRRTMVTGLQRFGTPLDVAAAVVNHKEGKAAGVTGIYARYDF